MTTYFRQVSESFFKVQKGEWSKVLLLFFYFFLVISTYYIIKPVRSSLFLEKLGPNMLPYVYMGEALVVGIVSFFYAGFVDRHKKENVLLTSTTIFSACLFIFWFLFRFQVSWFAFVFYLWGAVFSVMAVTQFWLLANDLFNPREAKRLFGLIGSGGVLGAICGGFLTAKTVHWVGTENLLLVAGFLILACVVFIKMACSLETADHSSTSSIPEDVDEEEKKQSLFTILTGSKYLILILLLIGVAKTLATLIDFQFQYSVSEALTQKDARTAFFGGFFAILNGVAFFIQFVLTSRILKKFGIGKALLILPIGLSVGFLGFLAFPILWLASFNKLYDGSLNYSIQSASREILYLPITRTVRHKIKPFIDMFIYRFSKGIGGLIILVGMTVFGLTERNLTWIAFLGISIWLGVVVALKREYIESLKVLISGKPVQEKEDAQSEEEISGDWLDTLKDEDVKKLFQEASSNLSAHNRKYIEFAELAIHQEGEVMSKSTRNFIKELLGQQLTSEFHQNKDVSLQLEAELERDLIDFLKKEKGFEKSWIPKFRRWLLEAHLSDGMRRKVIEALSLIRSKDSQQVLLAALENPHELLRTDLIKGLNKMRRDQKKPVLDLKLLKGYLQQEISRHNDISYLSHVYQERVLAMGSRANSISQLIQQALNRSQDESFERMFRLLALHYPAELIHLIHDRYKAGDRFVRSHAAELLDNIVGPDIEAILLPALEAELPTTESGVPLRKAESKSAVDRILSTQDGGLIVLALFIIIHLRMKEHYVQVEELSRDNRSLVARAAQMASAQIERSQV